MIVDDKKLIEKEIVSGLSYTKNDSMITISGIQDKPGISARIFGLLASENINVDMIVQNISQDGLSANITFTVPNRDINSVKSILNKNIKKINFRSLKTNKKISKISVIGMGMMSQSGVAQKMFKTLANNNINILAISTSEIKISVLIDEKYTNVAIESLHKSYNLKNDMDTVGKILKKRREEKNISLSNISNELNISLEVLVKIENDQILKNADIIYYIGHIRAYAKFIDLNGDDIISLFKQQISYSNNIKKLEISEPVFKNSIFKTQHFFSIFFIFVIFGSFYFLFINDSKQQRDYALVPDLPESLVPIIEKQDMNSFKLSKENFNEEKSIKDNILSPSSAVASQKSNKENITITLKLLNPTWIQIRDDLDKIIFSKLMEKDEEFSYSNTLNYSITAGNAGNILIIMDGEVLGKAGKYGEVIDTLVIQKDIIN